VELAHRVRHEHVLLAAALALAACRGRAVAPAPSADAALAGDAAKATAFAPDEPPPRGKALALVYTSNVGAEYERCGCPVHPLGGLARRAAEVDAIRVESDVVISVDAGDLFLPTTDGEPGRPPAPSEVERRARLLAAAYARLGVTAFSPGEHDLALGVPLLRRVLAEAKVPVVSANLVDARGAPLFPADRLVDAAGVKVGIFGVTASAPPAPERWRAWGAVVRDPVAAARAEVASLRARGARIIVALVHVGGTPDSKRLLRAVPGIDWAVLGHSGLNLETPELVATAGGGGARELEAMSLGRNLGRLDLHVVDGDGAGPFADRGARAQLRTILADHERQIVDYEQRLPATQTTPTLRAYYGKRLEELRRAVARETAGVAAMPARVSGNWFDNRIVPLDTSVADQPGVGALVAAYNHESDRLAAAGKPVGVKPPRAGAAPEPTHVGPPSDAPRVTVTYVGSAACARCHEPATAFWRTTKHARALATLEAAHRGKSAACVGCHVTGYFQPGGTEDLSVATTRLRDIGCEACHGPGSAHVASPAAAGAIARKVPEAVCLGCHTPDQTNTGFDYAAFLGAVVGPGHGPSTAAK
jgi:2',3'-cyclic-nucleotide 2'-phosphodiesterase (5'-nucleotidase family)